MVVADASSVILLAKAGVLRQFASSNDLVIPEIVYQEAVERGLESGREDAYRIEELIDEEKIVVSETDETDETEKDRIGDLFGITGGEAAAVAAGLTRDVLVLVDDRKGINVCKARDHPFATAIDVVVRLYELDTLSGRAASNALDDLETYGWYERSLVDHRRNQITGDR